LISTEADGSPARVLVLGAYGYLGAVLSAVMTQAGFEVFRQGRAADAQVRLDPTDKRALAATIDEIKPECLINLVAATNVDECESDPKLAERVNVGIVRNIAETVADSGIRFIQISTDQVYNGPGPHAEFDVDPINVYARTKLDGESEAEAVGALVLRVNIVGPAARPDRVSFSDWLIRQLRLKRPITLFSDVLFSPLEIFDIAHLIAQCMNSKLSGVLNLGSRDGTSKADFGRELAALLQLEETNIALGSVRDAGLKAPRPTDMRMDCSRFENATGIELPTIAETIRRTAMRHSDALTQGNAQP